MYLAHKTNKRVIKHHLSKYTVNYTILIYTIHIYIPY